MLRKALAGSIASLMLASGLVVAAPVTTAQAAPRFEDWGFAKAKTQVLRRGCHKYTYRYKIDPPKPYDSAAAEIFLIGPDGTNLASATKLTNFNPRRGRAQFKLCKPSVKFGRHTLRMKVTYKVGFNRFSGNVRPTTFRFVRPARR